MPNLTTKTKKVAKAVATVTVFSVATRALSFIFKIYLSRALGAEAMGLYQISLTIFYLFVSVGASGLPLVLSRKTAERNALGLPRTYSLFTSTLIIGLSVAIATVIILFSCRPLLSAIVGNATVMPLVLVMLPAIISTTVYSVIRGWFWGEKQFSCFSITETIEEVLRILFSVFFVSGIIGGISGAYGIAVAFTVSDVIVAVCLFAMYFAKGGRLSKPKNVRDVIAPALPITAMRIFGSLISTFLAVLLPARLIAAGMNQGEATASFGRIAGMANPLLLAPNAIISSLAIVLIPEMSATGARKEYTTLNKHINTGINFSLLICGLFMSAYFALGSKLTLLLFNDEISGEYLKWATFLMLPMCVNQMTQSALNSIGMEKNAFINYAIGTVLMLLAIYIMPKYIGIYAVIVASGISMLVSGILNLFSLRKKTGFRPSFIKNMFLITIFLVPCEFFTTSVCGILSFSQVFSVILSAIAGAAMYIALCLLTDAVDIRGFVTLGLSKFSVKKKARAITQQIVLS